MRNILKAFLFGIGVVALLLAAGLLWFFYYSRDLPDADALAQFAPTTVSQAFDPCLKATSVAIPYDSIGNNLRNALNAVEIGENDPGVISDAYRGFADLERPPRATLSLQISRTMFCTPSKPLQRDLAEIRAAAQLERRFSRRDLFTIYVNRIHFGENLIGVHDASQYLFHKDPNDLDVPQAALVAGLVRSPSRYSPTNTLIALCNGEMK